MKVYIAGYNGILDDVQEALRSRGQLADGYHSATHFLLWQDVRGDCEKIARIAKERLGKPVFVLQHGRGATRDYGEPNNFPLVADKILVWGETEKLRLLRYGIEPHRIAVVGCPLFKTLRPKNKDREGINVLFAPVIAQKEEPENLLVHAELKKWEANRLQAFLYKNFDGLKKAWATKNVVMRDGAVWKEEYLPTIPRGILYGDGLVNVKLTSVHDMHQYQSPLIVTTQADPNHKQVVAELLSNTDVMVCLEEGTMQLLACALDIPVVYVDIFKYGEYGGAKDYDRVEKIASPAVYRTTDLAKLPKLLDQALNNRAELRKQRIAVCEADGGAHLGDPIANILRELESHGKVLA